MGAKVWGAVVEITPKELIISLPHGLRAHVAAAEVRLVTTRAKCIAIVPQHPTSSISCVLFTSVQILGTQSKVVMSTTTDVPLSHEGLVEATLKLYSTFTGV